MMMSLQKDEKETRHLGFARAASQYGAVEPKGTAGDMHGNSLSSARDVRLEGRVRVWILQGILDFGVGILL
ncbi:hypothetical protein VitviT2T_015560 [Vitis vinifera]|uniref:Uncharacterized protein n=1 Tax=Vitis vinifera TaxID=29760 RepID=A0ABY9CP24_VITVI|nr:hypothetical protein VitviT2T_015560 [Vitis vinifera]